MAKRSKAAKSLKRIAAAKEKKAKRVKLQAGQNPPQSKSYSITSDKSVAAKTIGWRFTDEGAKRLGKSATTKPSKQEIEKYANKTFKVAGRKNQMSENGSFRYLYNEKRADKTDKSRTNKLRMGGVEGAGMFENGGDVSSLEKKIKDAFKVENKWHFINEEVDGKNVQLKMFVGKKEVDVQIFKIDGLDLYSRLPRNYVGKRDTLKMIMDNFQINSAKGGYMKKGGQAAPQSESYSARRDKDVKAKPVGYRLKGDIYRKPTKAEISKGKNVYWENRKDKSDVSPKDKYAKGGQAAPQSESYSARRDKDVKAKPVGYRLKGDSYRKPTKEEISKGKNVYWENRKDKSDVSPKDKYAKGGQAAPQSESYSARRDKDVKAKPVGYRLKGDIYRKPTKAEISKGKNVYWENRKDKSDVSPKDKYRWGGMYARGGVERISNAQAHVYAENHLPFKGNNLEGKVLDNGDYVVLSYGYYPIWFWSKKENKWYGNKDKYSVTTAKHISQSRPTMGAEVLPKGELDMVMARSSAFYTAMANGGSLDLIIGDASNNPQMDITSPTFQGS